MCHFSFDITGINTRVCIGNDNLFGFSLIKIFAATEKHSFYFLKKRKKENKNKKNRKKLCVRLIEYGRDKNDFLFRLFLLDSALAA